MAHLHQYKATTTWTGNRGKGTAGYTAYDRSHEISIDGKNTISASSDPAFRGDRTKHNPEEFLVSSLSSCHMLWYLHLCAEKGIVVTDYVDEASGSMEENSDGSGQFTEVTLRPKVTVADKAMIQQATELHHKANEMCFIARSVKFPVHHKPTTFSVQ
jgi:organic hydroperoxide reductase OsmC/OhrA